jgi:hypothetical protein
MNGDNAMAKKVTTVTKEVELVTPVEPAVETTPAVEPAVEPVTETEGESITPLDPVAEVPAEGETAVEDDTNKPQPASISIALPSPNVVKQTTDENIMALLRAKDDEIATLKAQLTALGEDNEKLRAAMNVDSMGMPKVPGL